MDTDRPRLLRHEQILRERPLLIDPLSIDPKSGTLGHGTHAFRAVLVRALRPDGFAFVEHYPQACAWNGHKLAPQRTQMHLDATVGLVPSRLVTKLLQIEVGAQFTIHARQ